MSEIPLRVVSLVVCDFDWSGAPQQSPSDLSLLLFEQSSHSCGKALPSIWLVTEWLAVNISTGIDSLSPSRIFIRGWADIHSGQEYYTDSLQNHSERRYAPDVADWIARKRTFFFRVPFPLKCLFSRTSIGASRLAQYKINSVKYCDKMYFPSLIVIERWICDRWSMAKSVMQQRH